MKRLFRHELKFALTAEQAAEAKKWARTHLEVDPHTPKGSRHYELQTLYLDNERMDVFHSQLPARGVKYRIRRYGNEPIAYLERKKRKGTRVTKRRSSFPIERLDDILSRTKKLKGWAKRFQQLVRNYSLEPMVLMSYQRAAFVGSDAARLTIDWRICAETSSEITSLSMNGDSVSASNEIVLELKYNGDTMPECFNEIMALLPRQPVGFSKYGKGVQSLGIASPPLEANNG